MLCHLHYEETEAAKRRNQSYCPQPHELVGRPLIGAFAVLTHASQLEGASVDRTGLSIE